MNSQTKELQCTVSDNIIEIETRKDFQGDYSVDNAEANKQLILDAIQEGENALILHFPDRYVKKDILKCYADEQYDHVVATALLAHSFSSKLIGNIFLTLKERFSKNKPPYPMKVFDQREEAIKWLKEHFTQV